jgi:hypothetical protein
MGAFCLVVLLFGDLNVTIAFEPPVSPPPPNAARQSSGRKDTKSDKHKGRASITGQTFLVTDTNKAVHQPGGLVVLLAVTRLTRDWFDRTITGFDCGPDAAASIDRRSDCRHEALHALLENKRLAALARTTRTNPTGHFWFVKVNPGKYYVISPISIGGEYAKDPTVAGTAWTVVDLEPGERLANVVVTEPR